MDLEGRQQAPELLTEIDHEGRRVGALVHDRSLDEASSTLGAGGATTARRELLRLVKPAVVGALVYGFVRSVTTVSAVIFLVSGDTDMATTYIIGRVVNGDYGVAIAYSAVLILLIVVAIVAIQWLVGVRVVAARTVEDAP